jgi:hypothetical protein
MNSSRNKAQLVSLSLSFSAISGMFLSVITPHSMAGGTVGCSGETPCINKAYQSGNNVVFEFNFIQDWDYYNVRYQVAGGVKQVENRSGKFTIKNVQPNRIYRISVQGCNKHFLRRSTCSPWTSDSVTTK